MQDHSTGGAGIDNRLNDSTNSSWPVVAFWSSVVLVIAIVLRVPSCYESFWVDELHSAWCVWGSFGDIFPRAHLGHQSPFYFVGLWFWKLVGGESEVMLRLSSVLAVAIASAVLTAGITRAVNLVGGFAAGLVLAMESNSLFFGTELRPYAFVILFASVSAVAFLRLAECRSRREDTRSWITMMGSILLAAICQPTSLGVLIWFPFVLFAIWLHRDAKALLRISIADALCTIGFVAVGVTLWKHTFGETWRQRQIWASFASADSLWQVWEAWDWTILLLAPLVVAFARYRMRDQSRPNLFSSTMTLAAIAFGSTLLYWAVTKIEFAPLWHRRYFIAVLPIMACVVGIAVGMIDTSKQRNFRTGIIAIAVTLGLIASLGYQQGTFTRLTDYPVALVTRGEDWRSAVKYVADNAGEEDSVYLDSGLIESVILDDSSSLLLLDKTQLDYLRYPMKGPYRAQQKVLHIDRNLNIRSMATPSEQGKRFVVTRRLVQNAQLSGSTDLDSLQIVTKKFSFGGVTVIVQPTMLDPGSERSPE